MKIPRPDLHWLRFALTAFLILGYALSFFQYSLTGLYRQAGSGGGLVDAPVFVVGAFASAAQIFALHGLAFVAVLWAAQGYGRKAVWGAGFLAGLILLASPLTVRAILSGIAPHSLYPALSAALPALSLAVHVLPGAALVAACLRLHPGAARRVGAVAVLASSFLLLPSAGFDWLAYWNFAVALVLAGILLPPGRAVIPPQARRWLVVAMISLALPVAFSVLPQVVAALQHDGVAMRMAALRQALAQPVYGAQFMATPLFLIGGLIALTAGSAARAVKSWVLALLVGSEALYLVHDRYLVIAFDLRGLGCAVWILSFVVVTLSLVIAVALHWRRPDPHSSYPYR